MYVDEYETRIRFVWICWAKLWNFSRIFIQDIRHEDITFGKFQGIYLRLNFRSTVFILKCLQPNKL